MKGLKSERVSSLESFSGDRQLRNDRSRWTVFICGPTLAISTRNVYQVSEYSPESPRCISRHYSTDVHLLVRASEQ